MKVNDNFVIRQIADEFIIVPIGETLINFNGMITVNEIGRFIWEQLQEDVTLEQVLNRIIDEYDVDKQTAKIDLEEFIDSLQQGGLLQRQ